MGSLIRRLWVIPPLIASNLIDYLKINKLQTQFSEDKRNHYITKGEVCRIRKDVLHTDIQLDLNDAQSTQGWVTQLHSKKKFVYYKDKWDPPSEGSDLASNLFILCIQTKFQKKSCSGSKNCPNVWLFWKDELTTNQENSVKWWKWYMS